jgi:DNA-binding LytR/AlgR family response regulator
MIKAIAIDDEPLALKVIQSFCNNYEDIELEKTFTQPSEALKYLRKYPCDLVFIDIQMPSITGISFVKALQQNTMVIFTTAYSEYAVEGFELNAIDYILKPFNQKRFEQAVNKAKEYYNYIHKKESQIEKDIFIRADYSLKKIPIAEILYIEGLADYLKVHIKDKKTIVARMTMKEMMEKLPSNDFIRVHRSFIIPINHIQAVKNQTIFLPEKQISIGKTYVNDFNARFKI